MQLEAARFVEDFSSASSHPKTFSLWWRGSKRTKGHGKEGGMVGPHKNKKRGAPGATPDLGSSIRQSAPNAGREGDKSGLRKNHGAKHNYCIRKVRVNYTNESITIDKLLEHSQS